MSSGTRQEVATVTLYLKVTKDRYELPVAVADSKKELARMVGRDVSGIYRAFAEGRKSCYVEVEVDDE